MKKEILYGIGGLLIGSVIASGITMYTCSAKDNPAVNTASYRMNDEDMTMRQMTASLQNKTGDELDKNFLSTMIVHHQSAIDMAKLVQQNAKHVEMKQLANGIIDAQSKEIDTMQMWQSDWGYKDMPKSHSMQMVR